MEAERYSVSVEVAERPLREIYLMVTTTTIACSAGLGIAHVLLIAIHDCAKTRQALVDHVCLFSIKRNPLYVMPLESDRREPTVANSPRHQYAHHYHHLI
jgi:hypothetical protein